MTRDDGQEYEQVLREQEYREFHESLKPSSPVYQQHRKDLEWLKQNWRLRDASTNS